MSFLLWDILEIRRAAHHDLARSLFNNTEVQGEDDIPSQHMCPLTRKPPFDAVHFDVPDGASFTTAANQQVYERSALFRCIATQVLNGTVK